MSGESTFRRGTGDSRSISFVHSCNIRCLDASSGYKYRLSSFKERVRTCVREHCQSDRIDLRARESLPRKFSNGEKKGCTLF